MGVLSITPSYEFVAHGLLPAAGFVPDPHPLRVDPNTLGPRDGPRTSHFIWDIITGGQPVVANPEQERHQQRATVDRRTGEEVGREQNRARAKRRMHPIAQSVKRARR